MLVATTRSAELCGALEEQGEFADMVAVEGDPYDFSGLRARVRGVWLAGNRVA